MQKMMVREVFADAVLVLPAVGLSVLVAASSGSVVIGAVGTLLSIASVAGLHASARRCAQLLGSRTLPWTVYGGTVVALWTAFAGILAIGRHFANTEARVDDSWLLVPAAAAAAVGIMATAVAGGAAILAVVTVVQVQRKSSAA